MNTPADKPRVANLTRERANELEHFFYGLFRDRGQRGFQTAHDMQEHWFKLRELTDFAFAKLAEESAVASDLSVLPEDERHVADYAAIHGATPHTLYLNAVAKTLDSEGWSGGADQVRDAIRWIERLEREHLEMQGRLARVTPSAIRATVPIKVRPLLVSGQLATDAHGPVILIDSESDIRDKEITFWHEVLHLVGMKGNENRIDRLAAQLAAACPGILRELSHNINGPDSTGGEALSSVAAQPSAIGEREAPPGMRWMLVEDNPPLKTEQLHHFGRLFGLRYVAGCSNGCVELYIEDDGNWHFQMRFDRHWLKDLEYVCGAALDEAPSSVARSEGKS